MVRPRHDRYDVAVRFLAKFPNQIGVAWWSETFRRSKGAGMAHCLFQFATPTGEGQTRQDGLQCGCLTQVRQACGRPRNAASRKAPQHVAFTEQLTRDIADDARIPFDIFEFEAEVAGLPYRERVERLNVFAEWQRRLDREIRRPLAAS